MIPRIISNQGKRANLNLDSLVESPQDVKVGALVI
jgi:hypothetical protein